MKNPDLKVERLGVDEALDLLFDQMEDLRRITYSAVSNIQKIIVFQSVIANILQDAGIISKEEFQEEIDVFSKKYKKQIKKTLENQFGPEYEIENYLHKIEDEYGISLQDLFSDDGPKA